MDELITQDVIDIPSDRDYLYSELEYAEGKEKSRPTEFYKILDQGHTPMCTLFAIWGIINGYNLLEDLSQEGNIVRPQTDPNIFGIDTIRHLQTRLENARKTGKIAGYLSIPKNIELQKRISQMKSAIANGLFIYTGTDRSRWTMTQSPTLSLGDKTYTGHAFSIVDYQSGLFKFINSYGTERGESGYGYIKENEVDKLFTCYPIIAKDNSDRFNKFRANKKYIEFLNQAKQIYEIGPEKLKRYLEKIQLSKNIKEIIGI